MSRRSINDSGTTSAKSMRKLSGFGYFENEGGWSYGPSVLLFVNVPGAHTSIHLHLKDSYQQLKGALSSLVPRAFAQLMYETRLFRSITESLGRPGKDT
uniref:Uncharacterized protein n=1 Tax=Timema douglasi TaxID=61478 RepID=A0A7R8Z7H0_TIMDO|nr:unnamed protein product [Timema douglasi]